MRLSRPCYDKPWRCPGWAGGGMRYARKQRCDGGRMRGWNHGERRWPHLTLHRCDTCGVVTLPFALRHLDPSWVWHTTGWRVSLWWRNLRNRWEGR